MATSCEPSSRRLDPVDKFLNDGGNVSVELVWPFEHQVMTRIFMTLGAQTGVIEMNLVTITPCSPILADYDVLKHCVSTASVRRAVRICETLDQWEAVVYSR